MSLISKRIKQHLDERGDERKRYMPQSVLSSVSIITIINRMMYNVNAKLTVHTECTAYIALCIMKSKNFDLGISQKNVLLLSLLHTIGFYKFSPDATSYDFFSESNYEKYLYAYHYLKNMTPLKAESEALIYYNSDYKNDSYAREIASIIFLASRISNYIHEHPYSSLPKDLRILAPGKLNPRLIQLFNRENENNKIVKAVLSGSFLSELKREIQTLVYRDEDTLKFLKLLVYILDFKTTSVLAHTINVSCYSIVIAQLMNLEPEQVDRIYTAALLHDIGKIVIPYYILESPRKLDANLMMIMREHVSYSYKIIEDVVAKDISLMVYRHHEKLNGTGYPELLSGSILTLSQRILTIADVLGGLTDTRTYKSGCSKEKTIENLEEMVKKGELDRRIVAVIIDAYDQIEEEVQLRRDAFCADFARIEEDFQSDKMLHLKFNS